VNEKPITLFKGLCCIALALHKSCTEHFFFFFLQVLRSFWWLYLYVHWSHKDLQHVGHSICPEVWYVDSDIQLKAGLFHFISTNDVYHTPSDFHEKKFIL
jgi:hypothetical protein